MTINIDFILISGSYKALSYITLSSFSRHTLITHISFGLLVEAGFNIFDLKILINTNNKHFV